MREFWTKSAILNKYESPVPIQPSLESKNASPPPSFLVREVWGHIALLEGDMAPFWQNGAIQPSREGCIAPFLPPGRVAWPHFGDGAMLPSFTTHVRKVVGGFGKENCVSTGVRKPGNTYVHINHTSYYFENGTYRIKS